MLTQSKLRVAHSVRHEGPSCRSRGSFEEAKTIQELASTAAQEMRDAFHRADALKLKAVRVSSRCGWSVALFADYSGSLHRINDREFDAAVKDCLARIKQDAAEVVFDALEGLPSIVYVEKRRRTKVARMCDRIPKEVSLPGAVPRRAWE